MFPVLFDISGFKVFTSGVMWFVGCCLAALILLRISRDQNLSYDLLMKMAFACLFGGIVGARLGYAHLNQEFFINNPLEILKFYEGGMVYYWGFGGGILASLLFWGRRPGWIRVCDIMILSLVPAHVMGRLGCFLHGCCFGLGFQKLPFFEFFLVRFPADNILRHPVQLYSALGLTVIFIILWQVYKKSRTPGIITITYVYSYAIFRFTIEYIRDDPRGNFVQSLPISTSQGIALLSIFLITAYLLLLKIGWLPKPKISEIPRR